MSIAGALDTIDSLISGVSNPSFTYVLRGEPLSVPTTPIAAFWLSSHTELFQTLGDASTACTFTIRCYWRQQLSPDVREDIEKEIWNAAVSIKTALRGDSNLSGNCTDSRPLDSVITIDILNGQPFITLTIPFQVDIYGEEPITP